jgi:hypothetical protein
MTPLPGFRATAIGIGATWSLLALSMLARGIPDAMSSYSIPKDQLEIAHYVDAMTWVFLHMLFIGSITIVMGATSRDGRQQRTFARLMLAGCSVYAYLDVRSADWALGTALYKGPGSLGPVVVGVIALVLWARLVFVRAPSLPQSGSARG